MKRNTRAVRAKQKVAAGMNYKMVTAIHDRNNKGIGSSTVNAYDHFGDYSASIWREDFLQLCIVKYDLLSLYIGNCQKRQVILLQATSIIT